MSQRPVTGSCKKHVGHTARGISAIFDLRGEAAFGRAARVRVPVLAERFGADAVTFGSCGGNQDARHIYSKLSDGINVGVNQPAPVVAPPAADFATWYENAIPGPSQTCTSSSGTPPTFDNNYQSEDNSVSSVADLTPDALRRVAW